MYVYDACKRLNLIEKREENKLWFKTPPKRDADHTKMKNMTTTRFSRAIKLFNVKLPLKRNESFYHSYSSFLSYQEQEEEEEDTTKGWPCGEPSYRLSYPAPIPIKKRSHSANHNFHIKKQFYSFNFFDYSFLFECSIFIRKFTVCSVPGTGVQCVESEWDKNVLIKAEIEKTEIKLILCWDFIIRFVTYITFFRGEKKPKW